MRPILVTGGNRTGTSWTGKMLCLASEVFLVWEPFNCQSPLPLHKHPLATHYRQVLPGESRAVRRFVNRKALFEIVHATPGGPGIGAKAAKLGKILTKAAGYALGSKAPLYKDPTAIMSAEWFQENYNARVVMVVRHPGAYVNSIRRLNWPMCVEEFASQPQLMETLPVSLQEEIHSRIAARNKPREYVLEDASLCWKVFYQVIHQYSKKHPDWIMVRHEDLSLDYINGFKALYESLELTWTPEVEERIEYFCNPVNKVTQGDVCHQFKQNSAALTRVWKNALSQEEQDTVRRITEPVSSLFYHDSTWD